MFVTLKTTSSSRHLLSMLFIFCCCFSVFSNFGHAVIVPLGAQGPYKMSIGDLDELLKVQRLPTDPMPFIVDKTPNELPIYAKIPYGAKREDKRREFEHGWEQCEFSPISCMLRRRKR